MVKKKNTKLLKNPDGSEGKRTIRIGNVTEKEAIDWAKEHIKGSDFKGNYEKENKIKTDKVDKKESKLKPGFEGNFKTKDGEELFVRVYKDGGVKVEGNNIRKDFKTTSEAETYLNKVTKSSESDLEKAKASKKQQKKIKKVMDEWKAGSLLDSHGNKIESRVQAVAVAMSEAGLSKKNK